MDDHRVTRALPVLGLVVFLGSLWLPFMTANNLRPADLPTQPPPTPITTETLVISTVIAPTPTATDTPQPLPTATDTPQPTSTVPSALTPEPQPPRP